MQVPAPGQRIHPGTRLEVRVEADKRLGPEPAVGVLRLNLLLNVGGSYFSKGPRELLVIVDHGLIELEDVHA